MTRAMTAQVLYNIAGNPETENNLTYPDADNLLWFTDAVEWAVAKGIVNGDAGRINPDSFADREQIAALVMRFCELYESNQ